MFGVNILELRGDKIARESIYVAEGWRRPSGARSGGPRRSHDDRSGSARARATRQPGGSDSLGGIEVREANE